jgi:hypothetical protein
MHGSDFGALMHHTTYPNDVLPFLLIEEVFECVNYQHAGGNHEHECQVLLQIPCSNAIQAVIFLTHQKIVQHLSGKTPAML